MAERRCPGEEPRAIDMEPETLEARISECGCDHRSPPNEAGRARAWGGAGVCGRGAGGRTWGLGLRVRPQGRAAGRDTVDQQGGGGESLCTGLPWEGASGQECVSPPLLLHPLELAGREWDQ